MKREWKPGDVAMVLNEYRVWNVAICALKLGHRDLVWRYGVADSWMPLTADARPLVVVDPEDREQVERLTRIFMDDHDSGDETADMQAALREFANPTPPKPDEPMGLGAVVEDAEGTRWVSWRSGLNYHHSRPWQRLEMDTDEWRDYEEIPVASVLFEGVS